MEFHVAALDALHGQRAQSGQVLREAYCRKDFG